MLRGENGIEKWPFLFRPIWCGEFSVRGFKFLAGGFFGSGSDPGYLRKKKIFTQKKTQTCKTTFSGVQMTVKLDEVLFQFGTHYEVEVC